MELFSQRSARPMLIAAQAQTFDDSDWIYELKLDGIRCLAYLDRGMVDLRNKKNLKINSRFPELEQVHEQVEGKCILDGEIVMLMNGVPDFYALQRRTLLTDRFRIELESARFPAVFVAFDCLYKHNKELIWEPLAARKQILQGLVKENGQIAVSRYIEEHGTALYHAAEQKELEGIVAKRKDSIYAMGKRSRDWIKCKRMEDEDFIVAGYIRKGKYTFSLILAKYRNGTLVYKGHVTSGVTKDTVDELGITRENPFYLLPAGNENAVWVYPDHVCVVEYMPNTKQALRQPVFKGYRLDVTPEEVKCLL